MSKFDITKHKWSDSRLSSDIAADKFSIKLKTDSVNPISFSHNKDDAISIANHFNLINNCPCKKTHYDSWEDTRSGKIILKNEGVT